MDTVCHNDADDNDTCGEIRFAEMQKHYGVMMTNPMSMEKDKIKEREGI